MIDNSYKSNENHEVETILKAFEDQVRKTPNKIAVVFKDEVVTYHDLNEKADKIASMIRTITQTSNSIIAIIANRSIQLIGGILAILRTGNAFLPIDPEYPDERIKYMLQDSKTEVILTQQIIGERFDSSFNKICIDQDKYICQSKQELSNITEYSNLAYILYTSSSTGSPKGVMIGQKSVINFINGITQIIDFSENKNRLMAFLEQHTISGSTKEIYDSQINHLAARLDAVYEKSCKGVHNNICESEAMLAIVHTYLFIAEIGRVIELNQQ